MAGKKNAALRFGVDEAALDLPGRLASWLYIRLKDHAVSISELLDIEPEVKVQLDPYVFLNIRPSTGLEICTHFVKPDDICQRFFAWQKNSGTS